MIWAAAPNTLLFRNKEYISGIFFRTKADIYLCESISQTKHKRSEGEHQV